MTDYLLDTSCFVEPSKEENLDKAYSRYLAWLLRKTNIHSNITMRGECVEAKVEVPESTMRTFFIRLPAEDDDEARPETPRLEDKNFPRLKIYSRTMLLDWISEEHRSRTKIAGFEKADESLVAHAYEYGFAVVTLEHDATKDDRAMKIPDFCRWLDVPCLHLLEMLRQEGGDEFIYNQLKVEFKGLERKRRAKE